jgi:hypothetical protein
VFRLLRHAHGHPRHARKNGLVVGIGACSSEVNHRAPDFSLSTFGRALRYLSSYEIKTLAALFVGAVAALSITQASPNYPPAEAAKHVGETVKVTGRVDAVHQSGKGNIFLNMGGKYPHQAFTAFIPTDSAAQFANPQQYEGRTVSVSGKVALYKGKPEIIVNSPSQISASVK